jgi:hypothetical protein
MNPSQKSRWEKRAREYARASDTPATSHYAYLQGVSDCFAEMAADIKYLKEIIRKVDNFATENRDAAREAGDARIAGAMCWLHDLVTSALTKEEDK